MDKTQIVCFELGPLCNLANVHERCPTSHEERFVNTETRRLLEDDQIVDAVHRLYREHGFGGFIAWHFYNEPLLYCNRMLPLMSRIRLGTSEARFLLWTNGTIFSKCDDFLFPTMALFEKVYLSNYTADGHPPERDAVEALRNMGVEVRESDFPLDHRRTVAWDNRSDQPCLRPFTELIFNCYGQAGICCYDWRMAASPGNLNLDGLDSVIKRFREIRDSVVGTNMTEEAPEACMRCNMRTAGITDIEPEIAEKGRKYREWLRSKASPQARPQAVLVNHRRKIGVVFPYFKMPSIYRLVEQVKWNATWFMRDEVSVYVVISYEPWLVDPKESDTHDELFESCHVHLCPFPESCMPYHKTDDGQWQRWFSITLTKNCGIWQALQEECEVVIATDADMVYRENCWDDLTSVVAGEARVPYYAMVSAPDDEVTNEDIDRGATGVMSMVRDDWDKVTYDMNLFGYGGDDGVIMRDASNTGLKIKRTSTVLHVAHDPNTPQINKPGRGRSDCWNRSTINRDNLDRNSHVSRHR